MIKRLPNEELFQTSDLALASAIYMQIPIEFLDKSDPKRISFSFKKNEELDQFVELFWKNQIKVNPRAYFESIKSLKYLIHQN